VNINCDPHAVGWKHNYAPGIRCHQNPETGLMELTEWPEVLGDYPTQEQADAWQVEYEASGVVQNAADTDALRGAGKDVTLVVVRLVQWVLDNTGMTPADFSPEARQAYQDLKVIADRLDPPV
jgi:hypothetical protein